MSEDTISRSLALKLFENAKKAAEKAYSGERLKGVISGINICAGLVSEMESVYKEGEGSV